MPPPSHPAITALHLDDAPSDTVRARVLSALIAYGTATRDETLVEAAKTVMPQANPYSAPKEWRDQYLDSFVSTADPDCCVDPDEGPRYCAEFWFGLTDAQRTERLAKPRMGFQDGLDDANALNDA